MKNFIFIIKTYFKNVDKIQNIFNLFFMMCKQKCNIDNFSLE